MQMRKVMTSLIVPQKDKSLIKHISWSIKAVFLKLGTINVRHKSHNVAPVAPLPWQQFCCKDFFLLTLTFPVYS